MATSIDAGLVDQNCNKIDCHNEDDEVSPMPSHKKLHNSSWLTLPIGLCMGLMMSFFGLMRFLFSFKCAFINYVFDDDIFCLLCLEISDSKFELGVLR